MGVYNSTYIGIYIEMPHIKTERKETKYKNPINGNKQKTKFNPDTGDEGVPYVITHTEWIEPDGYIEEEGYEEDMFFSPAYTGGKKTSTIIVNGGEYNLTTSDDLFNSDLSTIDPSQLLEDFKNDEKYKKYIEYFIKEYGEVNIKFGIVNYAH
jgi:hypothetical protein